MDEKEHRVYWQGLAYAAMNTVDQMLGRKARHWEGTTEDGFKADLKKALDRFNARHSEGYQEGLEKALKVYEEADEYADIYHNLCALIDERDVLKKKNDG